MENKRSTKNEAMVFGFILMLIGCFVLLRPAEVQAAKNKDYIINITKTTPKAAEKKLRKIKGNDKRDLGLRIKARNPKDAYKKTRAWLKKFQNLSANVYSVLPMFVDKSDIEFFHRDEKLKGYYCIYGEVSDYTNMNTICKRAMKNAENRYALTDLGILWDYEEKCILSYGSPTNPQFHETVNMNDILFDYDAAEKLSCAGTANAKALKKQSDSFRVQFFMSNLSGITCDNSLYSLKQGSLYAVAKKKCTLPNLQVANVANEIVEHLTLDCETAHAKIFARRVWRVKRSDGKWDYFGFDGGYVNSTIRMADAETVLEWIGSWTFGASGTYGKYVNAILSGLRKYVKKNEITEMDRAFLKDVVSGMTEEQIREKIEIYLREEADMRFDEPSEITYTMTNTNKETYGMESMSGSFLYTPE